MKSRVLIFVAMLVVFASTAQVSLRMVEDFNFNWKFQLQDAPNAKNIDFDDTSWRTLNLPHDWSVEQSYTTENTSGSTGFLPAGIGWYRKTFTVPSNMENKIVHIEFDGVYNNSEVWINGHYLGKRPYGYSIFSYDLTEHLNFGGENIISVKVDHSKYADSRWYTGSGIYRDVRLVTTSPVYVPQFGAWVETPVATSKKAEVDVFAIVENTLGESQDLLVKVFIKDPLDNIVAKSTKKIKSLSQDTVKLDLSIKNPMLWDLVTTNMYKANIQIISKNEILDEFIVDFGIRDIKFTADKGFFLNGENLKLKGVCLHHDAGAVGGAHIQDVWRRRLVKLKEIGVNAIRSSHNPAAPGLLELCDEMGFLVINEALDEWRRNKDKWITSRFAKDMYPEQKTGYGDIFEEWAERDVKDMVRSSRNHPSIIMWSMGNEIEWTYPYYYKMEKSNQGLGNQVLLEETEDGYDELKETAEQIRDWIKEIDKTRFVTAGGVLPKAGGITGYFDVPDVMGYNYRAINYDDDHRDFPNRIIYGAENWGTYQEWKDVKERDFVAGIFLWTGIAYMGESGPFPWKGLEISLLDFAGFYTPRGHFFKTLWSSEPSTYLATKHAKKAQWIYENGEWIDNRVRTWLEDWLFEDVEPTWNYDEGDSVFVEVYSNSPEVELFINDKSFGKKRPSDFEDRIVKYLVPYSQGTVKAVGVNNEIVESEYALKTAKWIGDIVLKVDRAKMKANGYDVAHIEAYTKTSSGDLVPDLERQIQFTVEGEGVNIGVDNGWDRNVQNHKSNNIVTHQGKALLLVQSTRQPGKIKISARSGTLQSNSIEIITE